MGVVYEARHTTFGTRHAVKLLRVPDPVLRARLVREGRLQARLVHRNVVPVEEVVEIDGAPALVMPFVEGPTLAQVMADQRLPEAVAIDVFRAVASGVAEIHRARLVHRDLKPANVLLEVLPGEVVPRVSDFGLAKALAAVEPTLQTGTGAMLGTPAHAAPEQLADAARAGPAADVFSLGCILYELLSGRRAFLGADRETRPALDGIPGVFGPLLARCLASDPAERPADAVALLGALPAAGPPVDLRPWCGRSDEVGPARTTLAPLGSPPLAALPGERDTFVGREAELQQIDALLSTGLRQLTLTGAGGIGKTRLLLGYGHLRGPRYAGGALWVDASTEAPIPALARALGLGEPTAALAERGPALLLLDAPNDPATSNDSSRSGCAWRPRSSSSPRAGGARRRGDDPDWGTPAHRRRRAVRGAGCPPALGLPTDGGRARADPGGSSPPSVESRWRSSSWRPSPAPGHPKVRRCRRRWRR